MIYLIKIAKSLSKKSNKKRKKIIILIKLKIKYKITFLLLFIIIEDIKKFNLRLYTLIIVREDIT